MSKSPPPEDSGEDYSEEGRLDERTQASEGAAGEARPDASAASGALSDLPEEERRLILETVNAFWRRWGGAFSSQSRDDMLGEAVLALHAARESAAGRPAPEAQRLLRLAIRRWLRKCAAEEFRQRLRRRAREWVALDSEQLERLRQEAVVDWDAFILDAVTEPANNPRLSAALGTLKPLDRSILALHVIERLPFAEVAARLNAGPAELREGRTLTAKGVARRCERAIARLKELLGESRGG